MTVGGERTGAFTGSSLPERYERFLVPYLFEPWARLLLDRAGLARGDAVLDVAAGTGIVTRLAAERVGPSGRVVACDISPAMVETIAARPPTSGSAPIDPVLAPADALGLDDGVFDVAVCQQGMPFFGDRAGAARELRRVLRPGGRAAVEVWAEGHGLLPFQPMSDVVRDAGATPPYPGAFDEATYVMSATTIDGLFRDAGFSEVVTEEVEVVTRWPSVRSLVDAIGGTPMGAALDALGAERGESARRDLEQRFAAYARAGGSVDIPTVSVVAVATV